MSRVETLVQLTDELVAALDQHAVALRRSRSALIREAVERYIAEVLEADIDRQIVEGYKRIPQGRDPFADVLLEESMKRDPW